MSKESRKRRQRRQQELADRRQSQQNRIISIVAGGLILIIVAVFAFQFLGQSGGESGGEPIVAGSAVSFDSCSPFETAESGAVAGISPAERNSYYSNQPAPIIDPTRGYMAVINVAGKGEMRLQLFTDAAPLTVNNFVYLADQGFYDGVDFHRVIDGFMAQGGDPTGSGTGGPGYAFADETNNGLVFDASGILAMANSGPNTNGSQFFITFGPTEWLNGNHTIFGAISEGQDVLNSITIREPGGAPPDVMEKVEILECS